MLNHTLIFTALRHDLVASGALQADVIVGLIRWFHPLGAEYVTRVSEWQAFLCGGTAMGLRVGPLLVRAKIAQEQHGIFFLTGEPVRVAAVHQIAMIFWKEEAIVEPDWQGFAQRVTTSGRPDLSHPIIGKLAAWLSQVMGKAPTWDEIEGVSGTGATADRRNASSRWVFDHIPLGVPCSLYRFSARDTTKGNTDVVLTARAAAVPKNRKSCRIVASEPSAALFAQLGLRKAMDKVLDKLRYKIPIRNADIHRNFLKRMSMARDIHKRATTIDLSDASDYISMDLANSVLPPDWAALCNACRSQAVRLPDGSVHTLATFAPMGNGFCFRTLSLICAGIMAVTCRDPWSDFGDDMIVSDRDHRFTLMGLEACGLRVNMTKTCTSDYVESCGLELYRGKDITPLKLKRVLTFKNRYQDFVAAARAAAHGLDEVASLLAEIGSLPTRYNRRYQRCEYRCPVWTSMHLDVKVDGWPGLMRWRSQRGMQYREVVHVESRTRPGFRWLADSELTYLAKEFATPVEGAPGILPWEQVEDIWPITEWQ